MSSTTDLLGDVDRLLSPVWASFPLWDRLGWAQLQMRPSQQEATIQPIRKRRTRCPGPSWCTPGPPTVACHGYTALCPHLGGGQWAVQPRASWLVTLEHTSTAAQAGVAQAKTVGSVQLSHSLGVGFTGAKQPAGREP